MSATETGAADRGAPPGRQDYVALDLMRGLAAFLVVLAHVRGTTFVEYGALPPSEQGIAAALFYAVTRIGLPAVLVFFVLSGYLVGGQVVTRVRAGSFRLGDYCADRASRILLPLIPACLLTAAITIFFFHSSIPAPQLLLNMVGLNEVLVPTLNFNAPLWTLAYEIWFYVLMGALAAMATNASPAVKWVAAIVVGLSLLVFSVIEARYFLYWLLGAAATFIVGGRAVRWPAAIGTLLLLAGIAFEQLASGSRAIAQAPMVPSGVAEAMICLGLFALLPICCTEAANRRLAWLRRPAAVFSGFSFSLYLFHYPINMALASVLPKHSSLGLDAFASYGMRVLILLLACYLLYRCFERQTPVVRRFLRARFGGAANRG